MQTSQLNVGLFVFDDVEVLDFAAPYEVFSRARLQPGIESRRSDASAPFNVFTVAESSEPILATGKLKVIPQYAFSECPTVDVLVVPGGWGIRALLHQESVLRWIHATAVRAKKVTSVCTGSLLLAKIGLLAGKAATTHWGALDLLASIDSSIKVVREERVVDSGPVTSAGVSAGIDMALYTVASFCGDHAARDAAHYMDYLTQWPIACSGQAVPVSAELENIGHVHTATLDDAAWCAALMATSEPWITLQRDEKEALKQLADPAKELYVVTRHDQRLGFALIDLQGPFSGYIQSICVAPNVRRRRLGTALLRFAEKRILRDRPNVFMCVSSFNHDAQRLYEREGYVRVGELTNFIIPGASEIVLRKTVGPKIEFQSK